MKAPTRKKKQTGNALTCLDYSTSDPVIQGHAVSTGLSQSCSKVSRMNYGALKTSFSHVFFFFSCFFFHFFMLFLFFSFFFIFYIFFGLVLVQFASVGFCFFVLSWSARSLHNSNHFSPASLTSNGCTCEKWNDPFLQELILLRGRGDTNPSCGPYSDIQRLCQGAFSVSAPVTPRKAEKQPPGLLQVQRCRQNAWPLGRLLGSLVTWIFVLSSGKGRLFWTNQMTALVIHDDPLHQRAWARLADAHDVTSIKNFKDSFSQVFRS